MAPKTTRGSAIGVIVARASKLALSAGWDDFKPSKATLLLKLVHTRHPLRLTEMAKGADFDLVHDVHGIYTKYDPTTGGFRDFWTPRYLKGGFERRGGAR